MKLCRIEDNVCSTQLLMVWISDLSFYSIYENLSYTSTCTLGEVYTVTNLVNTVFMKLIFVTIDWRLFIYNACYWALLITACFHRSSYLLATSAPDFTPINSLIGISPIHILQVK